jgi:diaminopimelate decarboxylase
MSQTYFPPTITDELGRQPIESAVERNAFSRGREAGYRETIDGVPVADLARRFGTPLFVFSERTLREKARAMREAFRSRYPRVEFAWSYKTNHLDAVCQVFRSEGWIADVASGMEYAKARRLGYAGREIVVNGPAKPRAVLERAMAEGAIAQIDNWDELGLVEEIAASASAPVDVGLRLLIDTGIRPMWSKFGFALADGEAERAASRVVRNPKLRLHTLHTHIGTFILLPEAYAVAARKMLALRDAIEARHGHLVPCLNLGGGLPSLSLLHGMLGPVERAVPPVDAYAEAITAVLKSVPARRRPLLRMENGRQLVDEAGYLVTRIAAVKGSKPGFGADADLAGIAYKEQLLRGNEARGGYVIDAGINLLYTAAWFRVEAMPARATNTPPHPVRLYGPLCMAIDVVREQAELPQLETGDLLTLHPVGAYNSNQSMQFIFGRPAMVMITEQGQAELIRRGETLEDFAGDERVPAHLAAG